MSKYFIKFSLIALLFCGNLLADVATRGENLQTIIVTCATGQLGTPLAKLLGKNHNLILTGRDLSKLEQLQKHLQAECPGHYDTCYLDYTNSASLVEFKKLIVKINKPIAGLVMMTPRPNFTKTLFQEEAD